MLIESLHMASLCLDALYLTKTENDIGIFYTIKAKTAQINKSAADRLWPSLSTGSLC